MDKQMSMRKYSFLKIVQGVKNLHGNEFMLFQVI